MYCRKKFSAMPQKNKRNAEDSSSQKSLSVKKGIKSRARVRERGEVFTNEREVNAILALTQATSNRYSRFLEPACGNGNFLEAILRQRLAHLKQDRMEWHPKNREFSVLKVLSTIYGVDIAEDNIADYRVKHGVAQEFQPLIVLWAAFVVTAPYTLVQQGLLIEGDVVRIET